MLLAQREIILSLLHTNPCGRDQSWGCSQPSPGTHSPHVMSGFVSAGTLYPQLFPQADSLPGMWKRSSCRRPPGQAESIQLFTQADTLQK